MEKMNFFNKFIFGEREAYNFFNFFLLLSFKILSRCIIAWWESIKIRSQNKSWCRKKSYIPLASCSIWGGCIILSRSRVVRHDNPRYWGFVAESFRRDFRSGARQSRIASPWAGLSALQLRGNAGNYERNPLRFTWKTCRQTLVLESTERRWAEKRARDEERRVEALPAATGNAMETWRSRK